MEDNPARSRPGASLETTLHRMDRFVALSLVGQHDIAQRLGLNVTDLTCLGHVLGAGAEPMTAGELAERANLTTGAVTGVLNRLERAGYVHRQADPADRRRIRVAADRSAAERVTAVYEPFYRRLTALFAGYDPDEIAVLADWFSRAEEQMRAHLDELRASGPGTPGGGEGTAVQDAERA